MITVCHIIAGLSSGGAERMLTRVVTRAPKRSEVHIVVSMLDEGTYGASLKDAGIELFCLRMQRGTFSLVPMLKLVRFLRSRRPDIVMTWLHPADFMGTICTTLAGTSLHRLVWNIRCSNMPAKRSVLGRLIVKSLAWMSTLPFAVAANSTAGRQEHIALGYRPRRWLLLPNGVDPAAWKPSVDLRHASRSELGVQPDQILCGMVARVDPQKDHQTFLAAAKLVAERCPSVRFLLVGEGTETLTLPTDLQSRTIAMGRRDDIPRLMNSLDIHVLSSAYGEGFPNVICEAMATGVPNVVTAVGDAATLVSGCGISVPPRAPSALADAIISLAQLPEADRKSLGNDAKNKAITTYNIEGVCRQYSNLWEDIVAHS